MHRPTDRIAHTTAFVTPVIEHIDVTLCLHLPISSKSSFICTIPHSQDNPHHCFCYTNREREMFYLTTHLTHFIYGYMASDIWLRTILIVRKETRCRHIGYSYRLTARVLLYAPSHTQDNTYHGLCYTSRGAQGGTRNSLYQ